MKRIFILLAICIAAIIPGISGCSNSDEGKSNVTGPLNWLADQDNALELAQSQNKPILINFYTDACPACRLMDQTTFTDTELISFLNSNFVNLKSNAGKTALYQRYGIRAVPTFIFSTPDGYSQNYEILRHVGYRDADQFYVLAQAVLEKWQS